MESRRHKNSIYVELVKYRCLHPECKSGSNIEVHHIIPIKQGGRDEYWNLISLCRSCHKKNKLHSNWEAKITELFGYKSYFELEAFGFVLDDYKKDKGYVRSMLYDARASSSKPSYSKPNATAKEIVSEVRKNKKSQREIAKEYGSSITCADVSRMKKGVVPKSHKKRKALGLKRTKRVEFCNHCDRYHDGGCVKPKKKKRRTFNPEMFIFKNIFEKPFDKKEFKMAAEKLNLFQRNQVKDTWLKFYGAKPGFISHATIKALIKTKRL